MKKIILLVAAAIFAANLSSAQYKPVEQGSSLAFTIKNFGFDVTGTFKGLQGDIKFDPNALPASTFDVSIDAATVNTDNNLRDNHLRGDAYFDVKNYPRIHLVSTKVTAGKNGAFVISGKLTIKKTTKNISFPFTATPTSDGYQFKGTFTINRKDYDVGGTSTIADNLDVSLNILAKKN
jgi:polyisoprenoid-binding protein YceI